MRNSANLRAPAGGHAPPKYVEVAERLLRHIREEGLGPGDRLGTEEELRLEHNASRFTIRHALAILAKEGYISREKARGTFVRMSPGTARSPMLLRGAVLVACSNEQATHADEDVAFATVLRSMERTLARQGFFVQILGLGEDGKEDRARLQHVLRREDLQGIVAIGPCLEPYMDLVEEIPTVFTGYFYGRIGPLVGDDVRVVCRESIAYLLARGHRDIAVICGAWIDGEAFKLFVEGCKEAYETAGVEFRRSLVHHAYSGESLVDLARGILSDRARPTAVFGENWRVCEAILDASRQLGLQIPNDLSVIGYGQNVLHVSAPAPLTAYVPDSAGIGRKTAELLVEMLDGQALPEDLCTMPGRLIERDSVVDLRRRSATNSPEDVG